MSVPDTPAQPPRRLPGRLGDRLGRAAADPGLLARDAAVLRESGYLTLAVPAPLGGAGLSLREVACAQRQLAACAPAAALAVTAHHAWVGAAADTLASGNRHEVAAHWVLREATRGRFFTGHPRLSRHAGAAWMADKPLRAGMFGWALPLTGMVWYAVARQTFDLAIGRACPQAAGDPGPGHPLDRWEVAEAALRLDSMRGQLDEAIDGWQQRAAAGGALTSLDPGGQWLIRLFTVRHIAADGARRVIELAAQIAGGRSGLADLLGPVGPVGPVGRMGPPLGPWGR